MEGFAGKTGAGSGIGRALAIELARSGAELAISDVDKEGLAVVTREVIDGVPGLKVGGPPDGVDVLAFTRRRSLCLTLTPVPMCSLVG